MKIAVLGAAGMLGRRVAEELHKGNHEVHLYARGPAFDLKFQWDVRCVTQQGFDWIVNCAGMVKSRIDASNQVDAVLVNSAMPHWLEDEGARVLHVSTDCVFSGKIGNYRPISNADPVDLYGASKLAGELRGRHSITVRMSFIGWEHGTERGLLEWLVRQKRVQGFTKALWSGLSARECARAIKKALEASTKWASLGGVFGQLYHLSGNAISKHDLLCELKTALKLDVEIEEAPGPEIDRTLMGDVFNEVFDYCAPTWVEMAEELARERPT